MTMLAAPLGFCGNPAHNEAAARADQYVALGEAPPPALLEPLLGDCLAATR